MIGEPSSESYFYGRETILKKMRQLVKASPRTKRHLAVTAPPKCGSSSLLAVLGKSLGGRGRKIVSLNGDQRSLDNLIEHGLFALVIGFLPSKKQKELEEKESHWTFQELVDLLPRRMKETRKEILDLWERWTGRMNPRDLFERYLSLFDRAQKEAGGGLWVVWDHFEKVLALVDETFIVGSIRKCLIGNRQVRWLVSITPPTVMDRLIGSKESPFFGLFECFKFGGLTYRESMKFMEVQKEMKALPSSSLSFLVALTGGHPFYLNVLSDGMEQARRVLGRRVNAQRLILETLTRELFAGGGRLHLYFRGLLAESFRMWRAPELYLGMLEAIARGQSSLVGISHALRREAPALSRQIQNLLDSGLVAKEGIFYFIPDPLFRFWIRHVHLAKRSARRLGDTGIESFRNHFEVLLKDFLSSTEMETVQRIAQILTASDGKAPLPLSGRSESIDNALDLLPRFDQVEMQQKLLGETFDLIARRGNEYWLLSVFEIVPTPSKLTQFSKQVGRVREAIPENQKARSVVIALGGFSQAGHKSTVRLQLDVWDRSGLNRLAECYGFLPIVG